MNNKEKLEQDIVSLINAIDISPTMYKNAEEKYKAIGRCLLDNGHEVNIYPQGSFALGTVVRPYKNSEEKEYDLDIICEIIEAKDSCSPKNVRETVKDTLNANAYYTDKIEDYDKCITIEYAKVGEADFNIDIIPSISEDAKKKAELLRLGNSLDQINTAIVIAVKNEEDYSWSNTINPKAYKSWFDMINTPFSEYEKRTRMQKLFESNKNIYNSIEDIPTYFNKSSLQMAIQFFKRARDVYFSKNNQYENRPISAIISTITANVAKNMPNNSSVIEIIQKVIEELKIYGEYRVMSESDFISNYYDKILISKKNGKWIMMNPTNPLDNLVDSWNENPNKATYFFEWVSTLNIASIVNCVINDEEYYAAIGNILGNKIVKRHFNVIYNTKMINEGTKPWKS